VQKGALHELKVCRRALGISHLLLADDTLLFFEANGEQARLVNDALRLYERGTGQLINPSKCSLLFGSDCLGPAQGKVKQILMVDNVASEEKYLGLPSPKGRMKQR
jgi:hypothetical protein